MRKLNFIMIISGATATGKSCLAIRLASEISGEIINADIGSFYKAMTIGTAKPYWQEESVPHHMFDIIDKPKSLSIVQFRESVKKLCNEIWSRGKVPVIVGGSAFYIRSLFYNQPDITGTDEIVKELEVSEKNSQDLWNELQAIDNKRAQAIDSHDRYRIVRALAIFKATGKKPSMFQPTFDPIASYHFIICDRDRSELYQRSDQRVLQMLDEGWINEVESMKKTGWMSFLQKKKMIGYDDLLLYLQDPSQDFKNIISRIQKRTRNYAKRQITFLKKLEKEVIRDQKLSKTKGSIERVDLTLCDVGLYIKQLSLTVSKKSIE